MENITFVVFGGTGDLARNRIIPAIALLYDTNKIGNLSTIIGIGRKSFTDESFKEYCELRSGIKVIYFRADIEAKTDLEGLPGLLEEIGNKNIIYYLSISNQLFGNVTSKLKELGLNQKPGYQIKIAFEKPFGTCLESSIALETNVHQAFEEKNVYRVDHFLGKETVQNLLVFRFGNPLFAKIWSGEFIEKIHIVGDEDIGVGSRVYYYDTAGAVKDMIQNHMLQLASFVLMDAPYSLDPDEIQYEKAKAIHYLDINGKEDIYIAQYEGYQDEAKAIQPNSKTETFAALKVYSKTPKWRDVPIYITTGKNLPAKIAEIIIEFKKDKQILYQSSRGVSNRLIIRIQPMQEVLLEINAKKHGSEEVEPVVMTFIRDFGFSRKSPETYAKLLYECILGNKILFISSDEIKESWRLIDKALSFNPKLEYYPKNQYPKFNFEERKCSAE
jgi:glucose-6-phosphate 1-dehydrogenase